MNARPLLVLLVLAAGCARTPEKLFPVHGTVRVGGEPLRGGAIQFEMLERGKSGKVYTSSGTVDQQGRYRLRTFDRDGAPAGRHRVWVVPNFATLPDQLGLGVDRISPIPKAYMDPTRTDLEFEVKEQENRIDVDIPQ